MSYFVIRYLHYYVFVLKFLTQLVSLFAISLQSVEVTNATFQRIVLIFLSFGIFSWVRNGIGLGLSNLGIILLLLLHHVNLHTINEQPKTRYPTISYSSMKLTISFVVCDTFLCYCRTVVNYLYMEYLCTTYKKEFDFIIRNYYHSKIFHKPKRKFEIIC